MPYPNDNKLNIVISQTSASADSTGKFPFTERIISGSNLFLLTDANGNITGSTSIPGGSFTNLNVTSLTASVISASTSITSSAIYDAGALTVVGNSILSNVFATSITASNISASGNVSSSTAWHNTLTVVGTSTFSGLVSASNGITASDAYVAGNQTVNGNLTVNGTVTGTISTASAVSIVPINDGSTYYVTFVSATSGSRQLRSDTDILSYVPSTNTVSIGTSASGSLVVGDSVANPDKIQISTALGSGPTVSIGGNIGNVSSSFVVGDILGASGSLTIQTYNTLTRNRGVITDLPISTSNTAQATSWNNGALTVAGGVGIGKNLYVSGSTFLYGDLTLYGSGSVVNISSSTVIIGDNRIILNSGAPIQRYAGIDVYDSGSGAIVNNVTSSLLWDSLTDNWLLVSNNSSSGAPLTQSSAIMIGGPSGGFGSEAKLTVNYIPVAQSSGKNLQNSSLSDNGTTLAYAGTGISASQITASQLTVQYTGSVTYATGVYITYATGSFTTITITTGSSPGVGAQVPSSPTSSGLAGQINVDNNFIYVYTNQVWKRVSLSTWSL